MRKVGFLMGVEGNSGDVPRRTCVLKATTGPLRIHALNILDTFFVHRDGRKMERHLAEELRWVSDCQLGTREREREGEEQYRITGAFSLFSVISLLGKMN